VDDFLSKYLYLVVHILKWNRARCDPKRPICEKISRKSLIIKPLQRFAEVSNLFRGPSSRSCSIPVKIRPEIFLRIVAGRKIPRRCALANLAVEKMFSCTLQDAARKVRDENFVIKA